ncbi:MAG: carbon-nitrogen hydrolase [Pseudomonadales bacterium]|nr:carbon-nitrogen hydrolase [Pseudomonadales bacterium]
MKDKSLITVAAIQQKYHSTAASTTISKNSSTTSSTPTTATTSTPTRLAIFQSAKQINLHRSREEIRDAATKGVNLVVLQELHSTHYFCQHEDSALFDLAETIPGPTSDFLSACAKEFQIVLVGSLFEKRSSGIFHNTAVVFDTDGSLKGLYRKMHIPEDPGYHEKFYFTPGDHNKNPFSPIETSIGKLGVLICWDQWYPEAARLMALAGADILLYPTAIGWDPKDNHDEQQRQLDAWITIQRSHGIANHLPIVSVNRCGHEPDETGTTLGIQFWGNSFICGPQGEILIQASEKQEGTLIAKIELSRSDTLKRVWPFFRDRRIDAYGNILKRCL